MKTQNNTHVSAQVKNYRGTPRKVRLLADLVRGKNAKRAIAELSFTNKRHAQAVAKAIQSAVANAVNNMNMDPHTLKVTDISVSEGKAMRRFRAGSRGMALRFKKRLSHINVTVGNGSQEVSAQETIDNSDEAQEVSAQETIDNSDEAQEVEAVQDNKEQK